MNEDTELLAELRALYDHADPVPPPVLAAARAAGDNVVDWEWLELLLDSAELAASVRGGPARQLAFGTADTSLDVELAADALRGLVTPAPPGSRIDVRWPGGGTRVEVDGHGRFDARPVPSGPMRLVLHRPGSRAVCTRWFAW